MEKKVIFGMILLIFIVILISVIIGLAFSVKTDITSYKVLTGTELDGLKILQLSDIHYPNNGTSLSEIAEKATELSPDLIFLTGDTLDGSGKKNDVDELSKFFNVLSQISKVFAVIGNHEIGNPYLNEFLFAAEKCNVTVLNNEIIKYGYGNRTIYIAGVKDDNNYSYKNIPSLKGITADDTVFLLAHRPEKFLSYVDETTAPPDYIFSGHAHGGQLRLFGKGIYSPNQGFFPKYTSGEYRYNTSIMYLSRGLGDGKSNFRWFNPYQIICVTFVAEL